MFHCNSVGGTSRRTPPLAFKYSRRPGDFTRGKIDREISTEISSRYAAGIYSARKADRTRPATRQSQYETRRGKSIYRTDREERSAMATHTRDGLRRIRISESKISTGYTGRRKTKGKSRNLIRRAVMRQTNERLVLHRNRIFPIAQERKRENVFRVVYAHGRVLKRQETPSSPTRGKGSVRRVCSKGRKRKITEKKR